MTSSSRQALQVQEAAARFNPQRKFTGLDPKQVRHVANQFKGEQQPERKCTGIDPQQVGVCAALCSLTRIFSRVLNETQVRKAASQFTNQDKKERRLTGLDPAKVGPAWLSGTVHRSPGSVLTVLRRCLRAGQQGGEGVQPRLGQEEHRGGAKAHGSEPRPRELLYR